MAILELRVSMKSEKCEKKVKRYLTLVPGIDKLEADWRTQKVSVEGRADTKTVLKRLRKTGMVVELWPQHLYDPAHALYAPLSYDTVTTYDHDYGYEQRYQPPMHDDKLATMFSDANPTNCSVM